MSQLILFMSDYFQPYLLHWDIGPIHYITRQGKYCTFYFTGKKMKQNIFKLVFYFLVMPSIYDCFHVRKGEKAFVVKGE